LNQILFSQKIFVHTFCGGGRGFGGLLAIC